MASGIAFQMCAIYGLQVMDSNLFKMQSRHHFVRDWFAANTEVWNIALRVEQLERERTGANDAMLLLLVVGQCGED